ncbi:MAG: hypothetical protein HY814_08550 [Candidatus Riflebacteria bacterium]|nr:hypothetical protein [Candidatus Riflebacteria bacterium]
MNGENENDVCPPGSGEQSAQPLPQADLVRQMEEGRLELETLRRLSELEDGAFLEALGEAWSRLPKGTHDRLAETFDAEGMGAVERPERLVTFCARETRERQSKPAARWLARLLTCTVDPVRQSCRETASRLLLEPGNPAKKDRTDTFWPARLGAASDLLPLARTIVDWLAEDGGKTVEPRTQFASLAWWTTILSGNRKKPTKLDASVTLSAALVPQWPTELQTRWAQHLASLGSTAPGCTSPAAAREVAKAAPQGPARPGLEAERADAALHPAFLAEFEEMKKRLARVEAWVDCDHERVELRHQVAQLQRELETARSRETALHGQLARSREEYARLEDHRSRLEARHKEEIASLLTKHQEELKAQQAAHQEKVKKELEWAADDGEEQLTQFKSRLRNELRVFHEDLDRVAGAPAEAELAETLRVLLSNVFVVLKRQGIAFE